MTDPIPSPHSHEPKQTRMAFYRDRWRGLRARSRLLIGGAAGAALLAMGAAGGAVGAGLLRPEPVIYDAGLAATPISDLVENDHVALNGEVVEIFGNKFVLEDGAARALVETGRAGEDKALVLVGEQLTVQGRFEHGFLHAGAIRHADGRIETIAPPPPPPGSRHDRP